MGNCGGSESEQTGGPRLNVRGNNQGGKGGPGAKGKVSECKVVILGDSSVGKTSIANRYLNNEFKEFHVNTIGAQFQQPNIKLRNGNTLKMNLWDTAGEEKFRSLLQIYYRDAKGAILTYDIGNSESFNNVESWIQALSDNIKKEDAILYLVGNKKDLDPQDKKVDTAVAQKFAEKHGMLFTEVSAKTGDGVSDLFKNLAEELAKKFKY